jgi:hypothetical protein
VNHKCTFLPQFTLEQILGEGVFASKFANL